MPVPRLLLVIGVAALIGAGALVFGGRPPADVGEALARPEPAPTAPATTLTEAPMPTPAATSEPASPPVPTRSARLADVRVQVPSPPTRLTAASVGIDAPVVPVGVEPDGLMEVPTTVAEVGWYAYGSAPGADEGSIVLAGHVDSRSQGRGAFFALQDLQPGDEVRLDDADGATTTWVVTGRSTIDKEVVPLDELFRREGPTRLVLVTCGGDFDADRRSYRSNVVVTAEPAP